MKNLSSQLRSANTELSHRNVLSNDDSDTQNVNLIDKEINEEEILDTDAIYDQKPSKLLMYFVFMILFVIITVLAFGFIGQVDTTISSRGKLTTKAPNVIVQASGSAEIESILVDRGDYVKINQVLAILNDTFTRSSFTSLSDKINAAEGRFKRFSLERNLIQNGKKVSEEDDLDKSNYEILTKKLIQYRSKDRSLSEKISRLNQEIISTTKNLEISKQQLELKEKLEKVQ